MNSKCPICFEELSEKSRATPDICDHIFCFPCLEQWSKHGSYCPVDRKRFRNIVNLDSETVIQIKPCRPKQSRVLYDVTAYCEVCKKSNNARTLLLCDCCDLGYHCKCLTPPLEEVPAGVWYCPVCVAVETRIKKPKETKAVQLENSDQTNQNDLLIEIEGNEDSDFTRIQANCARTRENISNQEQHCKKEIEATSLMKDDHQNNIYEETIKCTDISANKINVARSEANVCRSEELFDKKEVMPENLRKDLDANILDAEDDSSTSQNNVEKSESNNCRIEKKNSWSMRLRRRELSLKTSEIENYSSTSQGTIEQNVSVISKNKGDILSPSLMRNNHLVKTVNIPHDYSTSQVHKQAKNGSFSMIPRDHSIKITYIKNNTHSTKVLKHDNQEHGKNNILPSLFLTKQDHASIKNTVKETINTGCDFSEIPIKITRSSSRNIHISENSGNKYTVPESLRERDKKNWKDLHAETIEEFPAFHTNIASAARKTCNSQENGNKDIVPLSLRKIDCFRETIDSGEDIPTSSSALGNTHYAQENDKKDLLPQSLRTGDIRNWKDVHGETDSREKFPASESDIARSASGIIHREKKDIVPPGIKKKENKNRKVFHGETIDSGEESLLLQTNIAINASGNVHQSQDNEKKKIEPPSLRKRENRNWKGFHGETIDNVEDYLLLQTNIAKNSSGNIFHGQVNDKKDIVPPSSRKTDNRNWRDFYGETIDIEKDSTLHQTIMAKSMPWMIHDGQGNDKNMNDTVPCLRNSGNRNSTYLHEKAISTLNNFPTNQTNIARIASGNIYNDKKSVALPSQQKCDNRNGRDFNGDMLYTGGDSLSTQTNVEQSALKSIYSKQKHSKVNVLLLTDNRNCKDGDGKIIDIGVHSPAKQKSTSKPEWIIHSCQGPCKNDTASSLIKSCNRSDLNAEIIDAENGQARFQTNITESESGQEEYREANVGFKSLSKKEVCWNRQDLYDGNKNIQNQIPAFQSNVSRSKDTINQKESGRKGVSPSLMQLKTFLIEESKKKNKANTNSCASTNKTGVLIDRESSRIEKPYFDRKKSLTNYDFENLSLSSRKNEVKIKSIDNWHHKKKQYQAVCNNQISGKAIQAEVIPKNPHQVSPIRSTLCATPSNIKNFKFTNTCDFSPNFNNTDEDPIAACSRFSVFEPLQDTFASSQKYLNMNMAVNKMSCNSQSPLSIFSKSFSNSKSVLSPDTLLSKNQKSRKQAKKGEQSYKNSLQNSYLAHNPFGNYRSKEVDFAIKAKMNLAEELIKIEKEKWSQSLKKIKHAHLSRSACPKKPHKNTFNVCESHRGESTSKNIL